jgi:transcriptional regulator with XRE-family HTH domain
MLAQLLRETRNARGMTQADVAKELGISTVMYSYFESGLKVPILAHMEKLSKLFGVTIDYLVGNEKQAN